MREDDPAFALGTYPLRRWILRRAWKGMSGEWFSMAARPIAPRGLTVWPVAIDPTSNVFTVHRAPILLWVHGEWMQRVADFPELDTLVVSELVRDPCPALNPERYFWRDGELHSV